MKTRTYISKKWIQTILHAGLIAGSLDILLAFIDAWWSSRVSPDRVLRFIASGLVGNAAFQGPQSMLVLGLVIHFLIAYSWTILFFLIYPRFRTVVHQIIWQAVLFGLLIWTIMNLVILPITSAPRSILHWQNAIKGMLILMIAIGFPLAYKAKTFYHNRYLIHRRKKHYDHT